MLGRKVLKSAFIFSFGVFVFQSVNCSSPSPSEHYDVLIKNTSVVDGTGETAFKGSIAIQGEKIAAVGDVKGEADLVIDGTGLIACPGFIDPHNHSDVTIMRFPQAENFIQQGLTTVVAGNCGASAAPTREVSFGGWLSDLEELGISVNLAMMVGHGTVRTLVMGDDFKRDATNEELEQMKALVEEAMKSGAFGMSGGIDAPWVGYFASMDEKVELAKVVGRYGGFYAPHTRHERSHWATQDLDEFSYVLAYGPADDILVGRYQGLLEAVEMCRQAGIPLHIAHIPNAYLLPLPHPDYLEAAAARATMELVDKANAAGGTVTCDVILPVRSQTVKPIFLEFLTDRFDYPEWLSSLTKEELVENLEKKEFRDRIRGLYDDCRIKFSMIHTKADPYWGNCFMVVESRNPEYEGKLISEIAAMKNTGDLETVFDIIVEDPDSKWVACHDRRYNQTAVSEFLKHPLCEPCTDDYALPAKIAGEGIEATASAAVTATSFGAYPYYIKTYVKEKGILSLEDAVRKATSSPARRLGLNRGVLRAGAYADIVVFDYESIDMTVDFLQPDRQPEGIEYVLVNGKVAYRDKSHTGVKSGKVLRKSMPQQ